MRVTYYKYIKTESNGKKLCRFIATLDMISERRGRVKDVKIECMDKKIKISKNYTLELKQNEIGTLKNIISCYKED